MKTKEQRVTDAITNNPNWADARIAKNTSAPISLVRSIRANLAPSSDVDAHQEKAQGISLNGKNVMSRRPVESAAKFIKRLRANTAYRLRDLAQQWRMSEDTIRKHAKDLGCLKYVEVQEDEWEAMVMNPETAAKYRDL